MGYSTEFEGELKIVNELTPEQHNTLLGFFGEDCRDHPEWNEADANYIDLVFNDENTAIKWDDSTEKTYALEKCVNLILREMRKQWPDFALSGYLAAQGEDVSDSWNLIIGDDGWAHKVDRLNTGIDANKEFIQVQDNDCHHYVIPLEKSSEWDGFLNIDSDDEDSWEVPEWAVSVDGGSVIFKEWRIK